MHYHPFLPRRWAGAAALKWLRRVHAWTGLWGAASFLLLGASGFLLNHRNLMKIDTGEPVEIAAVTVPVAPGSIDGEDALERWAQRNLHLAVRGQPPKGAVPAPAPRTGTFLGRPVAVPMTWVRVFGLAGTRVTVSYVSGANFVTARREDVGVLNLLKNLHKGVGLPIAWVLLMDTIAGAIITMALTGFLLWSRLHGPRLLAGAIAGGSLLWAMAAIAGHL